MKAPKSIPVQLIKSLKSNTTVDYGRRGRDRKRRDVMPDVSLERLGFVHVSVAVVHVPMQRPGEFASA